MYRILAAVGLNSAPYMGQYTVTDGSDQFAVRADHNPNILAMYDEAVVLNKRDVATVVGRRAENSTVVEFPNRLHVVTGPAGRDATAGQAEGVCIDDDDS